MYVYITILRLPTHLIPIVVVLEAVHHLHHLLVLKVDVAHGPMLRKHCNLNVLRQPLWMMQDHTQFQVVPIINGLPLVLTHFNLILLLLIKLPSSHHKTIMLMSPMSRPEICTKVIIQPHLKQLVGKKSIVLIITNVVCLVWGKNKFFLNFTLILKYFHS